MIYFKDENNTVYALEQKDIKTYKKPNWIQITKEEVETLLAPCLEVLKKQKIADLHQKRDEINKSNYEFEGHTYRMEADVQADLLATITIFGAVGSLPEGYTIKDIKSGEYVPFDLPKLIKLSAAVATRKAALIFKTQKLEDEINKCNSIKELEKINLNLIKE